MATAAGNGGAHGIGPQLFIGSAPRPERMQPVRNGDGRTLPSVKCSGGLWTSSWDERQCQSAWFLYMTPQRRGDREGPASVTYLLTHELSGWVLTPRRDLRIWTVESVRDLEQLLARYGRNVQLDRHKRPRDYDAFETWASGKAINGKRVITRGQGRQGRQGWHLPTRLHVPNFEALVADGWDGLHITARGIEATCFSDPHLFGWETECTLWLGASGWPFEGEPWQAWQAKEPPVKLEPGQIPVVVERRARTERREDG